MRENLGAGRMTTRPEQAVAKSPKGSEMHRVNFNPSLSDCLRGTIWRPQILGAGDSFLIVVRMWQSGSGEDREAQNKWSLNCAFGRRS